MDCSQRAFLASQAMYGFMLTTLPANIYSDGIRMDTINEEGLKQIADNSVKMADIMMAALKFHPSGPEGAEQ